jgi:hypothetical protein
MVADSDTFMALYPLFFASLSLTITNPILSNMIRASSTSQSLSNQFVVNTGNKTFAGLTQQPSSAEKFMEELKAVYVFLVRI